MIKLTKQQMKERDQIAAWLNGKPFKQNSRDKDPQVPELGVEEVLNTYTPQYISDGGKFYTPLKMAEEFIGHLNISTGMQVLDPCAGIGSLLFPVYADSVKIDAIELDEEACKVGSRLFPDVSWIHGSPFDRLPRLTGKYDLVLMNPPFGTKWGTFEGELMSESRSKLSEHFFLELALRAAKPGGTVAVIAPYNFIEKLPKKMKKWFDEYAESFEDLGKLSGEFRFTKIRVHGWKIQRSAKVIEVAAEAVIQNAADTAAADEVIQEVSEVVPGSDGIVIEDAMTGVVLRGGKKTDTKVYNVTFKRKDLEDCLKVVADFIDKGTTLPVLAHVHIKTEKGNCLIEATNLEVSWTHNIKCSGDEVDKLLPASLFMREIKALHPAIDEVELHFLESTVKVNDRCEIYTMKGEEFPVIQYPGADSIEVTVKGFVQKTKRVIVAAGVSDTRYTLNSIYLDLENGHIVGTDGHRLHLEDIDNKGKEGKQVIIPRRAASLAVKYSSEETMTIGASHIMFMLAGGKMVARLTDGNYPAYLNVIPKENPLSTSFKADDFLRILSGAIPVSNDGKGIRLTINGRIDIESTNPSLGSYKWHVPCSSEGIDGSFTIAFNAQYLIDAITSYKTDDGDIVMRMSEPLAPCLLNDKAVLMPMRV